MIDRQVDIPLAGCYLEADVKDNTFGLSCLLFRELSFKKN